MLQTQSGSIYVSNEAFQDQAKSPRKAEDSKELGYNVGKVLVVDDHKLIADTISEILREAAFQVATAYDGQTALEMVTYFQPDYLLSDVQMPRMNGVELAIAIRKMYPTTKIFLISGQAGISGVLLDAQRHGLEFDLIAKPIHPLKLIDRLKDLQ